MAWDGESVLFAAVDESRILRYDPESQAVGEFRRHTNRTLGIAYTSDGCLFGAQGGSRRVVCFNADGSMTCPADRLEGRIHNHPWDICVDAEGRIWFSDPYSKIAAPGPQLHRQLDHASVLRLSRSQRREWGITRVTYDTAFPRGVQVSKDSRTLYVTEDDPDPVGKRELRAYPIREDGSLGPCSVLHTFGSDHRGVHRGGQGMCLAENGLLVCAGDEKAGPGPMVYLFAPSGRILKTFPVPDAPVSCYLVKNSLYVTTLNGALYRARDLSA
jgi:gluconolactonase